MAEVLAEHWFSPADYAYCRCGVDMSPGKPAGAHEALAAHQASALSAAGFGLAADARAEALAEVAEDVLEGLKETAPQDVLAIGFVEGYAEAARDHATRTKPV